jgi:broad specificity phosphatase PhoE
MTKGTRQKANLRTALAALALTLLPAIASAQQTVFVVRHAERADGGAGANTMTGTPADPPLSSAGEARAQKLASMLADAGIKAIYVTEFKRTQDTAKPLAAKLGLRVEVIPSKDTAALIAKVRAEHPNDAVLIVGHSNTVPDVVKAFTGRTVTMSDEEYSAMFVLTPNAGTAALIRW